MNKIETLFEQYAVSHQNQTNILIHKFCVPLIFYSIVGLLYCLPYIGSYSPAFGFALLALAYYLNLSKKYALLVLPYLLICFALAHYLRSISVQTLLVSSLVIFVVSWILQFIGHKIEGKKPSFLEDLQFLMIGPLWVIKKIFKI